MALLIALQGVYPERQRAGLLRVCPPHASTHGREQEGACAEKKHNRRHYRGIDPLHVEIERVSLIVNRRRDSEDLLCTTSPGAHRPAPAVTAALSPLCISASWMENVGFTGTRVQRHVQ